MGWQAGTDTNQQTQVGWSHALYRHKQGSLVVMSVWLKDLGCELSLFMTLLGLAASDLRWPQQAEECASVGVLSNSKDNIQHLQGGSELLAFLNYHCKERHI